MAILNIRIIGDPVLRTVADPVTDFGPELAKLVADMTETMEDVDGAGLAAPQVHVSRRIVIYGVHHNPRYPDAEDVPLTVLVNPKITPATREIEEDWEGCLSVPDMRGRVPRYTRVNVEAYGRDGGRLRFAADGFHARVVQHECDHLDGILYPQRIRDMRKFGFTDILFPDIVGEED